MKRVSGNFTIVLNEYITDKGLDCYEFRVLCYLLKLADGESTCYPSHSNIARETSMGITKVKKSIKKLMDKKYITLTHRLNKNGGKSSNLYKLS